MGKLAPNPVPPQIVTQRTHSGRSYWVRNIPAPTGDVDCDIPPQAGLEPTSPASVGADPSRTGPGKAVSKPSAKKRFVEPYRLSDEQRDAMLAPLTERGVGDAESRDLFAAALAYDIATCYELTTAEPSVQEPLQETREPPSAAVTKPTGGKGRGIAPKTAQASNQPAKATLPPDLAEVAQAARALTERLQALAVPTKIGLFQSLREGDRFHRGYDDDYLSALTAELLRLAEGAAPEGAGVKAQDTSTDQPEMPAPVPVRKHPPTPKPSPAARQFIVRAAGAFEECFDQAPTAQVGGPFAAMLKALAVATGIRIPTDARNLAEILRRT